MTEDTGAKRSDIPTCNREIYLSHQGPIISAREQKEGGSATLQWVWQIEIKGKAVFRLYMQWNILGLSKDLSPEKGTTIHGAWMLVTCLTEEIRQIPV